MTANRRNTRVPEQEARQIPGALIASVLFGTLTLFTLYLILFVTDGGALSGARAFLKGLCGHLYVVFPLVPLWLCVLCAFRATGRKVAVWRIIANLGLVVCFYSAVQLFFCEGVELANLNGQGTPAILSWADFVAKSYRFGKGGGALGAMLAGPLYHYLGKALGLIAILLLAALLMAITGKIGKMARMVKKGSHDAEQRRLERRNDDMFNTDTMLDNAFNDRRPSRNVPRNAPRSSTPNRGRRLYKEDLEPRAAQARTTEPRAESASVASEQPTRTERVRPAAYPDSEAPRTAANRRRSVDYDESDVPTTEPVPETPVVKAVPEPEEPPKPVRMPRKPSKADSVSEKKASSAPVEQINLDDLRIEPDAYEDESPEAEIRPEPAVTLPKLKRSAAAQEPEEEDAYNYPPIDLLAPAPRGEALADNNADLQKAKLLEETLRSFGISTKLTGIAHGPAVTRFELQPAPGVKVSRITSLADDIALNLAAISVRIEAPIPGKAAVGVEVPNDKIETVALRDVLESNDARKHPSRIAVGLGKDNSGRFIIADVAKMPHVLIAGQTGSGKSVCINSIIVSILYRSTPDEVRLILIDPKVVELSVYNGIPHLIAPVVTDPKKAASALDWAVVEMTNRYKKFAERGVRDMKGYNKALREGEKPMPHMVIIIDELADLMMVSPGEVEDSICRLAQLARAAGMHLVIATQRPSVNVITGIIKANIPTRIAFLVASQVDSRTIIDHGGAEKLLGHGDMLYVPAGIQKPMRVQGSWVSDEEVHSIVEFIKERHEADYDEDVLEHINNAVLSDAEKEEVSDEYDPRLPEAIEIVMEAGQASISMLQRRMRVGYARAGRLIDEMSQRGIVSEADGAKPRTVLITREQFNQMFEDEG